MPNRGLADVCIKNQNVQNTKNFLFDKTQDFSSYVLQARTVCLFAATPGVQLQNHGDTEDDEMTISQNLTTVA